MGLRYNIVPVAEYNKKIIQKYGYDNYPLHTFSKRNGQLRKTGYVAYGLDIDMQVLGKTKEEARQKFERNMTKYYNK